MGCDRELLSRFRDGELTPEERRRVAAHLASCPECADTLSAYKSIGRSIAGLDRLTAPGGLRGGVYYRIAQHRAPSSGGNTLSSLLSGLALAGTSMVVLLLLSLFLRGMSGTAGEVQATAIYPALNASDVPPSSAIEVKFNKPMDRRSVETSVAIMPTVEATVAWQGEKLVLKPVNSLAANTDYTITIGSQAKDVQGKSIKESVVLHFSTGSIGVPIETASPALVSAAISITATATATPSNTSTPTALKPTETPTPTPTFTPSASRFRLVLVHPRSPSTILAVTTTGAIYKSTDSGASWRAAGLGLPKEAYELNNLLADPQIDQLLYAATSRGIYRSRDGGENWDPINDGLPVAGSFGVPNVQVLAMHPKFRQVLYAGLPSGSPASIYRSGDAGASWSPLGSVDLEGAAKSIGPDRLMLYPDMPNTIVAGTPHGVFLSTDGGATWKPAGKNLAEPVTSLAINPRDSSTLYASTRTGIYKTATSEIDWRRLVTSTGSLFIRGLSMGPDGSIYATTTLSETAGQRSTAIRSMDGGDSWEQVKGGLENTEPLSFAFDPSNSRTVYAATMAGIFRSANGGGRWTQIGFALSPTPTPTVLSREGPQPTATPVTPPSIVSPTARIGYVYDSRINSDYTGDWPVHLRARGHSVTPLDIRDEMAFDPEGYDLIVIGWLTGQEPAGNIAKLQKAKAPILNGYSPLVAMLGLGTVFDVGNPGRTIYGRTITIEPGGAAFTSGYSGEVIVASDTLYRVPIVTNGTLLATITDEQMGVRNAPVWTVSGSKMYFGFWYSSDGSNHNEAYWTFFDRSVDYLLR